MTVSAIQSDTVLPDATVSASVGDMVDQAIALHDDGEFDRAENLYRDVLTIDPVIFHNIYYATCQCKRNIKMTPCAG